MWFQGAHNSHLFNNLNIFFSEEMVLLLFALLCMSYMSCWLCGASSQRHLLLQEKEHPKHVTCSTICHLQPLIPIEASDIGWKHHTSSSSRMTHITMHLTVKSTTKYLIMFYFFLIFRCSHMHLESMSSQPMAQRNHKRQTPWQEMRSQHPL